MASRGKPGNPIILSVSVTSQSSPVMPYHCEDEHGVRIVGSRAQGLGILLLFGPIDVVCDKNHPVHVASKGASGGSDTCQSQHCELVLSSHRVHYPGKAFMCVGRGNCLQACFGNRPLGTKRRYRQSQPIPEQGRYEPSCACLNLRSPQPPYTHLGSKIHWEASSPLKHHN